MFDYLFQIMLSNLPSTAGAGGYNTYCSFAGTGIGSLDAAGWINITLLVLGINFALAAVLWAVSGIFPTAYREKIKGAVKYEAFQGIVSCGILAVLIGASFSLCNIGHLLVYGSTTAQYQNPIQYSEFYVNNLMLNTGLQLFDSIYSESVLLTLTGNIADTLEQIIPEWTITPVFDISFGAGLLGIFYGFSGAMTGTFLSLIAITFGVLFMVYLLLPFVQQLAFTIVLPLALVMRSIPFAGPNLRQTSDTFLALASGFYLIFPLTILLNGFIITWIYTPCNAGGISPALCNPYVQYTGLYKLDNLPVSSLFSSNPTTFAAGSGFLGGQTIPDTFYTSSGFSGGIPLAGPLLNGLVNITENLFILPSTILGFATQTAQYLFQGIFLIGLDFAITVGFAMGLSKGLNSAGRMLGVGPFWGNY